MQRKAISQEEARAKTTAWALTFADLTTLLLTFFVLLLVILNDAEAHVDRLVNIILDETERELKPLQQNNLVEIERVTKGIKIMFMYFDPMYLLFMAPALILAGIASSKTADELDDPVQGIIVPIGTALADLILL